MRRWCRRRRPWPPLLLHPIGVASQNADVVNEDVAISSVVLLRDPIGLREEAIGSMLWFLASIHATVAERSSRRCSLSQDQFPVGCFTVLVAWGALSASGDRRSPVSEIPPVCPLHGLHGLACTPPLGPESRAALAA